MKILLIAGGWSTERDVSLAGARGMESALRERGHDVTFFDLRDNFDRLLETARAHDFCLINLHGAPGEDGLVQAMLERVHCPYQGSGPAGSFVKNRLPRFRRQRQLLPDTDKSRCGIAGRRRKRQ